MKCLETMGHWRDRSRNSVLVSADRDREGEEAALREEKQEQKWEIRSERNESVPYR